MPAGLIGLDLEQFLERARRMEAQCKPTVPAARNPGLVLGTILGIAALKGRDKLTFLCDPEISSFGSWLEQLIAESSGKQNKGIIPIDIEPVAEEYQYSDDRFFVYLRLNGRNEGTAHCSIAG